jgi:hypothetical protein
VRLLLSGHSDENRLLELLLTYKVFVNMLYYCVYPMILLLHGGNDCILQLFM